MAHSFEIPIIPNSPLDTADGKEAFGLMGLKRNMTSRLIVNALFDENLISYDDNYQNDQAVSAAFSDHMQSVFEILKNTYSKGAKLVEVGCGKGSFIELAEKGNWFDLRGYDAAYEGQHPKIEKRFLNAEDNIEADIVVLRHVLEHIQKPQSFVSTLSEIFGDTDIYIEVPDFDWIVANQAFFDITYEHVNYFDQQSLSNLFTKASSSGRLFNNQYQYVLSNLNNLSTENYMGDKWEDVDFGFLFDRFLPLIEEIRDRARNRKVIIWGGATKGVLFCHHLLRFMPDLISQIPFVVDINPRKQGKFLPSSHLPIVSAEYFVSTAQGDELVLIMNPNYEPEISAFLKEQGQETLSILCV
ncbi:MAG: class I SAM-dependent methyltransferase [Sneathiella sp.]|uniref:class I SAM-dependent methyltransferase n=1 Tax=Sneathiella sp. TaxID=1964365 RepID=UPI0030033EEE